MSGFVAAVCLSVTTSGERDPGAMGEMGEMILGCCSWGMCFPEVPVTEEHHPLCEIVLIESVTSLLNQLSSNHCRGVLKEIPLKSFHIEYSNSLTRAGEANSEETRLAYFQRRHNWTNNGCQKLKLQLLKVSHLGRLLFCQWVMTCLGFPKINFETCHFFFCIFIPMATTD